MKGIPLSASLWFIINLAFDQVYIMQEEKSSLVYHAQQVTFQAYY